MNNPIALHRRQVIIGLARMAQLATVPSIVQRATAGTAATGTILLPELSLDRGQNLLVQPQVIRSSSGFLDAELTAAPGNVSLGDLTVAGILYNGSYLPPMLRASVGDVLRIKFRNRLIDDPSNLHFHGMSVSPRGNGDNVFIHVHPGDDFRYEVTIPAHGRQSAGLFWYHPHLHGIVDKQLEGGLSGGLVIDGSDQYFPILTDVPEQFLFFKHYEHHEQQIFSVNGQINPIIELRPGEVQFWRIANIGASEFVKFRIQNVPIYVIATDGHMLSRPKRQTEAFLGPGERIEALVVGPPSGEYAMETLAFSNQSWNPPGPGQRLATVVSSGAPIHVSDRESAILGLRVQGERWIDEIRRTPITRRRTLNYSRTVDRKMFMIDGHIMDESRIDQTVRLGDTEEWTIVNHDQQYHSFHIHQTPFLVTEFGGVPVQEDSLHDTCSVPPATKLGPSSLKVIIPFTDPAIVGKFVYHCHAVDHEDKGMMGIIEVVA